MPQGYKSLLKVLREVRQWRPGIKLWELKPEALTVSDFRPLKEADTVAHWDIDTLLKTVEDDYSRMTVEERAEFDALEYTWGYTGDGLVSIAEDNPEHGMVTQFLQVKGPSLRKLSSSKM